MRILITGASGYIGRHLSSHAVSNGHEVIGAYLSESELSGHSFPNKGIRWVPLDLQDFASQGVVHPPGATSISPFQTRMGPVD
jgi:nucleoside-diphosphate-sugar epimerase